MAPVPEETHAPTSVVVDDGKAPSDPDEDDAKTKKRLCSCSVADIVAIYWEHEFLILVVLAILLALAYPPLGATYLAPKITATWIAVVFIFLLAGLSLKTEEFAKASKRVSFNLFVPIYNFGVVSALAFGLSRFLVDAVKIIPVALANGMLICSALPLTISMVQVLTKAAGGDEAAAIFHSALGNLVGVVLSPLLILGYLGVTSMDVADLGTVFLNLLLRVVLPIIVGQVMQKTLPPVVQFVKTHKVQLKLAQQYALVFIVYTVFCKTFEDGLSDPNIAVHVILMVVFQFLLLLSVMLLAWYSLGYLFPADPKLRVMGLFGCTHKTVAMGIPLINAIYFNNPNVGLYTLPLLVWHSLQLLIGSMIAPRLSAWVEREQTRLGIVVADDYDEGVAVASVTQDDVDAPDEEQQVQQQPSVVDDSDVVEGSRRN